MRTAAVLATAVFALSPPAASGGSIPHDACPAVGVVKMKYPKSESGNRGACLATAIDPSGDFLVPRHCIEGARSAEYTPLRVGKGARTRPYPVKGVYREAPSGSAGDAALLRGDIVRIHVDLGEIEASAVLVADTIPAGGDGLELVVNRGTRRGKAGDCGAEDVAVVSTFDAAGYPGRTISISSETAKGGSGSPVFASGRLVGFVIGGTRFPTGQYNDVVAAVVGHPALRRDGQLVTFAQWNEAHANDASAFLFAARGDCAADETLLARVVELDPSAAAAWYRRAACAVHAGDDERAIEFLAASVAHEPKPESLFHLGQLALSRDRDVEQGRKALADALAIDPDLTPARLTLAGSYAEKGELDRAKTHFLEAFERSPGLAEAILPEIAEAYPELASQLRDAIGEPP